MSETIGQRQLRNDNAEIMRRVEAGESFVVTRNGKPVAELRPIDPQPAHRSMTIGELRELWADLPPMSVEQWNRERAEADEIFGPDDIDS